MKYFDVIYQQFEKLEKDQEYGVLDKINKDDLNGLRRVRNYSSHDYDNIENEIIEDAIRNNLPKFKKNIQEVLKETKKELCQNLEKNVDYFVKKQDILMPEAKNNLIKNIKKEYEILQEQDIKLDKEYSKKIKNIIKENSKQNLK
ncbi:HepT-like ribonuclease domain-containing protein [Campylobacter portucalensis]|uniref:HepT-like ribonuclease domain-containing protein n=1 Tax=Campylobacter portucalensis TaxID=2608384 RepID=UPI001E2E4664|nr:HepT-like ribonuclease domain-containing protein [Campylobacter portucalensis]